MGRCRFDLAPQLESELRVNSSPGPKPLPQVIFDRFGSDLRKCEFAEYRSQELQRIHILLVVSGAPEWRL